MKFQPHHIALLVCLLILAVGSIAFSFMLGAEIDSQKKLRDTLFEQSDLSAHDGIDTRIAEPPEWSDFLPHTLFTSRYLVYYPKSKTTAPFDPAQEMDDGITGVWKQEHNFPLDDIAVAKSDADQDGFTNYDEYKFGTDPRDSASSPPPIQKLRLDTFTPVPFELRFNGRAPDISGSGYVYQINLPKHRKTLLVREGDFINIEKKTSGPDEQGWRVGEFREKLVERTNPATKLTTEVDESELDLHHPLLKDKVMVLVRNKVTPSDESKVSFLALIPHTPNVESIFLGETFKFKEQEYQVLKASEQNATLKAMKSGESFSIPAVTSEERDWLKRLTEGPTEESSAGGEGEGNDFPFDFQ